MFKQIMWATDGSEEADRALTVAKSLAFEGEKTLDDRPRRQKIATSGDSALAWYADEELVEERSGGSHRSSPRKGWK